MKLIDINWLLGQPSAYEISIENMDGILLFKNNLLDVRNVNERDDISNLPHGNYYLSIRSDEQVYVKSIFVK